MIAILDTLVLLAGLFVAACLIVTTLGLARTAADRDDEDTQ